MNRTPRLLEVFFSFDSGGSERIGAVLAEALAARGWTVDVAATHSLDGPIRRALAATGIACHGLDIERRGRLARRWAIFRLCRRLRPDVLHAQHIPMFTLCFWPAWFAGVRRFVVSEHTDYQLRTDARIRRLLRRYARRAERIVVIHEGLARYLVDELGVPAGRVGVIANGVDSARFAPAASDAALRRTLGAAEGDCLIGCVARLHPDKDHAALLEAFARVLAGDPARAAHLVLIGDGGERAAIERRVGEADLAGRVTLLGDRADIDRLVPQLDLFVLASRTEGLPMVLLEAMACGVPCVATAVGGIPALLADGGGVVVPPGDVAGLARALGDYVDDPARRRAEGSRARERVLAGCREADMVEAYARALAGPAAPDGAPGRVGQDAPREHGAP